MLNDKTMVNDYLATMNASLSGYGAIIAQTDNEVLRQTLIQMRNADESRQRCLYEYAAQKGYYQPAETAPTQEIMNVKNALQQGMQNQTGMQPMEPMTPIDQVNITIQTTSSTQSATRPASATQAAAQPTNTAQPKNKSC